MTGVSRCDLHGCPLSTGEAEILYGIWHSPSHDTRASRELFPNANLGVPGGCFYSRDFPVSKSVRFCPACRHAAKEWIAFFKRS